MSVSSSLKRQLDDFERPARPALGTTGQPKGPARQLPYAQRLRLARLQLAAAGHAQLDAELADAQASRSTTLRRAALAFLLAVGFALALAVAFA
jgi:hypothetical protein